VYDWLPERVLPAPPRRTLQTLGVPEHIRKHFQALDLEASREMEPADEMHKEVPTVFHSAACLDDLSSAPRGAAGAYGYPATVFKVVSRDDSQPYALRRLDGVRTTPAVADRVLQRWQHVRHPSVVALHDVTLQHRAVFFRHEYHAGARTLRQRCAADPAPPPEAAVWRLLAQMLLGLRAVHAQGLAFRTLGPTTILITPGMRARLGGGGIGDLLEFESPRPAEELARDDVVKLGLAVLAMATRSASVPPAAAPSALAMLAQHCSPELHALLSRMAAGTMGAEDALVEAGHAVARELDVALATSDAMHAQLAMEYQSSRMLRLLIKMGWINERPGDMAQWSESEGRYVLKLARDAIFHQVDANGAPVLDAGHVIQSLAKLDAGADEHVVLSSRDGKNLLVASYRDVRVALEEAFQELYSASSMGHSGP